MNKKELKTLIGSHESRERFHFFQSQIEQGLDFDRCIGIHGTSLRTILEGIRTGFIPGSPAAKDEFYDESARDLYLYPLQRHASLLPIGFEPLKEHIAWYQARKYAESNAFSYEFLDLLKLNKEIFYDVSPHLVRLMTYESPDVPTTMLDSDLDALSSIHSIDKETLSSIIRRVDDVRVVANEESISIFENMGFTRAQLLSAREKALKYKGVLFGLHRDMLDQYPILLGDTGEGDLRVRTRDGIDIKFISGFYVQGKKEMQILNRIKKIKNQSHLGFNL